LIDIQAKDQITLDIDFSDGDCQILTAKQRIVKFFYFLTCGQITVKGMSHMNTLYVPLGSVNNAFIPIAYRNGCTSHYRPPCACAPPTVRHRRFMCLPVVFI